MLKDFESKKRQDSAQVSEETKELQMQLLGQQQLLMQAKIPVIVMIEGWAAAGKGSRYTETCRRARPADKAANAACAADAM